MICWAMLPRVHMNPNHTTCTQHAILYQLLFATQIVYAGLPDTVDARVSLIK